MRKRISLLGFMVLMVSGIGFARAGLNDTDLILVEKQSGRCTHYWKNVEFNGVEINSSSTPAEILGDEIPIPFGLLNQRVELAHGEYYILQGQVKEADDILYFDIDLSEHPYLMRGNTKQPRYYAIVENSKFDVRPLVGSIARVTVRAEGAVQFNACDEKFYYTLILNPVKEAERINNARRAIRRPD